MDPVVVKNPTSAKLSFFNNDNTSGWKSLIINCPQYLHEPPDGEERFFQLPGQDCLRVSGIPAPVM
jgi:hypothetical protein